MAHRVRCCPSKLDSCGRPLVDAKRQDLPSFVGLEQSPAPVRRGKTGGARRTQGRPWRCSGRPRGLRTANAGQELSGRGGVPSLRIQEKRRGFSKVLGPEDGWEREAGSSALLRWVLPLDLGGDDVCSVLVSWQPTRGRDKVMRDVA